MKKALLMIGGEYHPFESCGSILAEFLKGYGSAECTVTTDREALRKLDGYDVVIVYTQGGTLTAEQEKSLCDWVHGGGAFVGIHCADDSWVENERYMEMIGTQFAGHGPVTEFEVRIADADHEVTRSLREFRITDEFYILKRRTDAELRQLLSGTWQSIAHPMAYGREYGKGRVFYTALGHDERAFNHPTFRKLIHRAIWWTTRSNKPGPVRFGIIGYGPAFLMGKCHADTVRDTPLLEVTAICDTSPTRLEVAREEQPGVELFTNYREMIDSGLMDVGIIVTPHNTHGPIAIDLLNAGIGVVCEKPFCLTVDEATEMIETARARNLMLTVFHNRRWDADFLTVKKVIDDGLIGEVFHIEAFMGNYAHPGNWWRTDKTISGGVIRDWGAHFIDWILLLMPYKMQSVTGFFSKRVWHDVSNEDYGKAIIRFEGDRSAELEVSHIAAAAKPKWRILGTKGGLTADWEQPVKVTTYIHGNGEKVEVPLLESRWAADFYAGFADHLLGGEPLQVSPESARRVIAVAELGEKSHASGQAEPVPFEE